MQRLPINPNKVKKLIKQCKHFNIHPMDLPSSDPKTNAPPVSELLEDLIPELVMYLSRMQETELAALVDSLPPVIKLLTNYPDPSADRNALLDRIAIYYLVMLLQADYFSFKKVVHQDISQSIVIKKYPELEIKFDKDNLLLIDDSFKLREWGIEYKDHILHYHQFLRRGYTSNPNFDFTGRFLRYFIKTNNRNHFRIAIDHSRLWPKDYYRWMMELDIWFGPRFDESSLDNPKAIGLTVIKRINKPKLDLTNKLDSTEFFWHYRKGIKTLEIEELSGEGNTFDHYYINRYVHSERNIKTKTLQHFDGAVKIYLHDSYSNRLTSHMPGAFKSHEKIKLFRIDGDVDIDEWIDLIAYFYRGNEMILEYFDPEQYEKIYGSQ